MPPARRASVGIDAAGAAKDDMTADGSAPRGGRTGKSAGVRGVRGGRGREKGRSNGSAAGARVNGDGGPGDEGGSDDDAGYSRSPSPGSSAPRAVSPELGLPPVAPAPGAGLPRSSSLSLLSEDRSPSPATPAPAQPFSSATKTASVAADDADDTFLASPSSTATARAAITPGRKVTLLDVPGSLRRVGSSRTVDDSLSELETSDDEKRAGAAVRAESSDDEPLASTSASSPVLGRSAAPHAHPDSQSPAPSSAPVAKRRGRPPGSKNKQPKAPVPRSQRGAAKADPPYRAPSGSEGAASPGAPGGKVRATRANLTLPPGYIEGVTSSRWPRLSGRRKRDENGEEDEDDEEEGDEMPEGKMEGVTGTTTPVESRASSVNGLGAAVDADAEEKKPVLDPVVDRKGKGRALDADEEDDVSMNGGEGAVGVSAAMSRETSLDEGSVTPAPTATPTKGKGRGKGKRGKKAQTLPEPVERAKRRKLDVPDKEAEARHAAREGARSKFLDQLDAELDQVEDRSHPLFEVVYQRLREEKADRLDRLRRYQDEREKEFALLLDKRIQASWRQWADQKDALRMKLYLENHNSLKELMAEEKVFPFFRDHPLFINNHDLPPTGFYRGPQRDPAFQPRDVIHAGHYVEPPPLNSALAHDAWKLAPEEIEADLALFYDIEEEPFYAPPPPAPVPPPAGVGVYGYPPPPFYYDPHAPPPAAAPYMVPPGYAPVPHMPQPGAPYGLPTYYPPPASVPHPASGPPPPHLAASRNPYASPAYPFEPRSPAATTAATSALAPPREPAPPAPAPQQSLQPGFAPLSQPKVSPTLHKAPMPMPAKATSPAVNGRSAASPPLPPMQMTRPPLHGSPAAPTMNGRSHGHSHTHAHPHSHSHSHSHGPSQSHGHSHSQGQQHTQPRPQAQQHSSQPHAHPQHINPPTYPYSLQPSSPQRTREAHPAPYPAQRFSPSSGAGVPLGSAAALSASKSPALAGAGAGGGALPPMRGTLFPSMPTPASAAPSASPPAPPARSPTMANGAAPTLPSLSRKTGSPPRPPAPQPPSGGGAAGGAVVERVLPPFWAASPPAGVAALSPPQQHQQTQQAQQVGPVTGLPLPSWLKPLAQQVKLPHEVRREEEARVKAAQAQAQAQAQGRGGWAS